MHGGQIKHHNFLEGSVRVGGLHTPKKKNHKENLSLLKWIATICQDFIWGKVD